MKAVPIIPGQLYRVTHKGRTVEVPAVNAADALAKVTGDLLKPPP